MSVINVPENLIIREFTSSKQVKLFDSLLQAGLTGYLNFINPVKQNQWYFSLYKGQVLYATDNKYFLRRWQRNLVSFLPQINFDPSYVHQLSFDHNRVEPSQTFWEYELLHSWVEQQQITFEQAQELIYSTVTEILFDITQGMEVICRVETDDSLSPLLAPISLASVIPEVKKQWQQWQDSMIADRSPNLAPVILQPNQLQKRTATQFYRAWSNLLNGELTLRDLAVTKKIPVLNIIQILLPYIQSGIIGLVEVGDAENADNSDTVLMLDEDQQKPLIACIDDSKSTTSMIEQIFAIAGYRFMAINNPLEAISSLKEQQPDIILLDLYMPEMDGYQLCSQLRQDPNFAKTPIIFLTSSDRVIDRIKSKMVGSSHFIQKTVDADQLIYTINQYLPSEASDT